MASGSVEAASAEASGSVGIFPESAITVPITAIRPRPPQTPQPETSTPPDAAEDVPSEAERASRQMVADLESRFARDFYIWWEDRRPVIVLGERITFNAGEALLLEEAGDALKRVARAIAAHSACRVMVTGHTDDRPINTRAFPSNWELSAARAASVAKALIDNGVSPRQVIIRGQAEYKPLVHNTTTDGRRINRRVEISLISPASDAARPHGVSYP